jgi:hypothetical protein
MAPVRTAGKKGHGHEALFAIQTIGRSILLLLKESSIPYLHWNLAAYRLPRGLPTPLSFGDFIPTSIVSRWLLVGLLETSFAYSEEFPFDVVSLIEKSCPSRVGRNKRVPTAEEVFARVYAIVSLVASR